MESQGKPLAKRLCEPSKTSRTLFRKTLSNWLAIFSETFSKELSEAAVRVYEMALEDLSAEELEEACRAAIRDCRFLPTPADIRAVLRRQDGLQIGYSADAEWGEIVGVIWAYSGAHDGIPESWGFQAPPRLSEAGLHAARTVGGFEAIQRAEPKHLPILQKQFREIYERYVVARREGIALLPPAVPANRSLPPGDSRSLELVPMPEEFTAALRAIVKPMPGGK